MRELSESSELSDSLRSSVVSFVNDSSTLRSLRLTCSGFMRLVTHISMHTYTDINRHIHVHAHTQTDTHRHTQTQTDAYTDAHRRIHPLYAYTHAQRHIHLFVFSDRRVIFEACGESLCLYSRSVLSASFMYDPTLPATIAASGASCRGRSCLPMI